MSEDFSPQKGDWVLVKVWQVPVHSNDDVIIEAGKNDRAYVHKSAIRPLPPAKTPTEAEVVRRAYLMAVYLKNRPGPHPSAACGLIHAVDADYAASAETAPAKTSVRDTCGLCEYDALSECRSCILSNDPNPEAFSRKELVSALNFKYKQFESVSLTALERAVVDAADAHVTHFGTGIARDTGATLWKAVADLRTARAASAEAVTASPEPVTQAEPVPLNALEREALEAALIHWNTPSGTAEGHAAFDKWHDAAEKVMAARAPVDPVARLRAIQAQISEQAEKGKVAEPWQLTELDAAIAALEARK